MLDTYRHNDNRRNNEGRRKKRRKKTSLTIFLPLTLLQGFERVVQGLRVRGNWRPNINCNILTPLLWPSRCVFLVLLGCPTGGLGAHSAGCWLSLWHLISIFSGPLTPSGVSDDPLGRVWLSLPHLVSNSLEFYYQLLLRLDSTQLYNNSTPTRSLTGSLKSNV